MFEKLRQFVGLQPPLAGLEDVLAQVQAGSVSIDEAATQIRQFAAQPHIPPWAPRLMRFAGVLFAAIGIGFGVYSATFAIGTAAANGTVLEVQGGSQSSPTIEYVVQGRRFIHVSSMSSSPPRYRVGDKVEMLYRISDPKSAQIDSFVDRWLIPVMFTVSGTSTFYFSYFVRQFLDRIMGTSSIAAAGVTPPAQTTPST